MNRIKVLHKQTLFDIAIQYCGTSESVFDIAKLNNKSITAELSPGEELVIPDTDYGFKEVVKYFVTEKKKIATRETTSNTSNESNNYGLPLIFPF